VRVLPDIEGQSVLIAAKHGEWKIISVFRLDKFARRARH
jgi:hypothetical protein